MQKLIDAPPFFPLSFFLSFSLLFHIFTNQVCFWQLALKISYIKIIHYALWLLSSLPTHSTSHPSILPRLNKCVCFIYVFVVVVLISESLNLPRASASPWIWICAVDLGEYSSKYTVKTMYFPPWEPSIANISTDTIREMSALWIDKGNSCVLPRR